MNVNYYAVNKVLGGRMVHLAQQPQFGHFNLLRTTGDLLGQKELMFHRSQIPTKFSIEDDRKIAEAFESVRDGYAPERVLWDEKLSAKFVERTNQLALRAPLAVLNRRLMNIRKNPKRYAGHGIFLSESDPSKVDPKPSVVWQYAHAIEFALVRIKIRYGASIDDILLDPVLVSEYEQLARKIAKNLTSVQLRLGALYIRKTRHIDAKEESLFEKLDTSRADAAFQSIGTIDRVKPADAPPSEGIIQVLDQKRYLYVSKNANLRLVVEQFVKGPTLSTLANHFWEPDPSTISIRMLPGEEFEGVTMNRWQKKLIQVHDPIFNWPLHRDAA